MEQLVRTSLDSAKFDDWVEELERQNGHLTDTDYVLSDDELYRHIKFHSCNKLRIAATSKEGAKLKKYQELKEFLSARDVERRDDLARGLC